ncbi:RNA-directed DNA polymerase [Artemisia annua]|uniref:RNA-directed DNA polymerase n=1 Tax=Artemisia annua TaxID=35608 RepID=A0A2U1MXS4_ARTAN|nr:RNA-directed DNA polymerase [Artemisia annua]
MEHRHNESKHIKPVKQKPHQVTPARSAAIKEEVDKLTAAGILRRVENPRWVTNPIAAQRRSGEWIIQHDQKKEECLESGAEQQASTK